MKDPCVLCVSVFSAFKVIVTRGEQEERRGRRDAEHAEILHPSSFIPHPSSLLNRIYSTQKENNMHSRSEEVVNYLDKTRMELREAVESVPIHARNQKPADD